MIVQEMNGRTILIEGMQLLFLGVAADFGRRFGVIDCVAKTDFIVEEIFHRPLQGVLDNARLRLNEVGELLPIFVSVAQRLRDCDST